MNGKTIATKLHNIENGILGVQNNPDIQDKLSVFGYTPERILIGRRLLDKVLGLTSAQREEYRPSNATKLSMSCINGIAVFAQLRGLLCMRRPNCSNLWGFHLNGN
jgi:hypothetical protein